MKASPRSLDTVLQRFRPYVGEALAPVETWERAVALTAGLPAAEGVPFGWELRLDEDGTGADVSLGYKRPEAALAAMRGSWLAAEACARRWTELDDWRATVQALWLEFDLSRAAAPPPGVLLQLDTVAGGGPPFDLVGLCGIAFGAPLPPALAAALHRVVAQLPTGLHPVNVGCMHGREPPAVRLFLGSLRPEPLLTFLERLGLRDERATLSPWLDALAPHADIYNLALDVAAEGPRPRLGVEFLRRDVHRHDQQAILDALVEAGACLPGRAAAIAAAIGTTPEEDADGWAAVVRWLNHVKVVVEPGAAPRAKAYLGTELVRL